MGAAAVSIYYSDDMVTLHHGDCVEVMRELPDNSVDAVVTDPPYGLEFMGKEWDAPWKTSGDVEIVNEGMNDSHPFRDGTQRVRYGTDDMPGFQQWCNAWATEAHRILKPGGHLLAFGGTRTWHRLAVAIEDAGFEVRDSICWLYASGFPKSLDVSKAIDKKRDDKQAVARVAQHMLDALQKSGKTRSEIDAHFGTANVSQYWFSPHRNAQIVPADKWPWVREWLGIGGELDDEVWRLNGRKGKPGEAWDLRAVTGAHEQSTAQQVWMQNYSDHVALPPKERKDIPATPAAEQWQGWGTALKPAHEPIVVARKPLMGTVAENVLAHGTGALNVDGCRIGTEQRINNSSGAPGANNYRLQGGDGRNVENAKRYAEASKAMPPTEATGRWPANVILDESQAAELDRQADERPARFFYVPKANASERPKDGDTAHPTVKPLDLMRYLVKLVTPPGGTVLEPFAGSGTTLEACVVEGFNVIGIELTEDYLPLIVQRVSKPIEQVLW